MAGNKISIPDTRHFLGTALIGMSIIIFETLLTRVFAVTLWYYFGFLSISLALLGFGAAGMYLHARGLPEDPEKSDRMLSRAAVLFALTAIASIAFHFNVTFVGKSMGGAGFYFQLLMHVVMLAIPFFFGGMCIALVLTRFASNGQRTCERRTRR